MRIGDRIFEGIVTAVKIVVVIGIWACSFGIVFLISLIAFALAGLESLWFPAVTATLGAFAVLWFITRALGEVVDVGVGLFGSETASRHALGADPPPGATTPEDSPPARSPERRLASLKRMRDDGSISAEEYERYRRKILDEV